MAVAGFKIAVNHCLRPFNDIPVSLYTNIPLAYIKCIPEDSGKHSVSGKSEYSETILSSVDYWVKDFLDKIGETEKIFRFDIKLLPHAQLSRELHPISILSSICTMLNEWLHHPMEKNDLLAWLIEKNQYKDADIICACLYGGIMSHVGIRPFRIYQPKGLYFHIETIFEHDVQHVPVSIIPIFIMALERSDFVTIHDLLHKINPIGNLQESYLGALDLPGSPLRLHLYNVSTPENVSIPSIDTFSEMFEIDSNGCSVI